MKSCVAWGTTAVPRCSRIQVWRSLCWVPAYAELHHEECLFMTHIAMSLAGSGTPRTQLLSIQYLRGLAALSVLGTHALQWPLTEMNLRLLKTGRLRVHLFFVISGFIITTIAVCGRLHPNDFFIS